MTSHLCRTLLRWTALPLLALLGACSSATGTPASPEPSAPATEPAPSPVATVPPADEPEPQAGPVDNAPAHPGPIPSGPMGAPPLTKPAGPFKCRLDAPKLSGDPCQSDADCAPSAPCHAPACIAKSKAPPPDPKVMCTRDLVCASADANRCGCFEGQCALIPPTP